MDEYEYLVSRTTCLTPRDCHVTQRFKIACFADFAAQKGIIKHNSNQFMYIIVIKENSRIIFEDPCHVQCLLCNVNKLLKMSHKIRIHNQHKMGNGKMFNQQLKFRNIKHEEVPQKYNIKDIRRKICEFFILHLFICEKLSQYLSKRDIELRYILLFRLFWNFVKSEKLTMRASCLLAYSYSPYVKKLQFTAPKKLRKFYVNEI